jgi:RNA polymerase sigma factor (sigma-70 family)
VAVQVDLRIFVPPRKSLLPFVAAVTITLPMNGTELLSAFRLGSQDAFAGVVSRYVNFVYSIAKRRLVNSALTEEVCQDVFTRLARSTTTFESETQLLGWLHKTTMFVAIDVVRSEVRRKSREQKAATMHQTNSEQSAWNEVYPVLDEALQRLTDAERAVLLLRYFDGKTMQQVGHTLGLTENAAKMRVSRATEHLRSQLIRSGVTCGLVVLADLLAQRTIEAAPNKLVESLSSRPFPRYSTQVQFRRKVRIGLLASLGLIVLGLFSFKAFSDRQIERTAIKPSEGFLAEGRKSNFLGAKEGSTKALNGRDMTGHRRAVRLRVLDKDTGFALSGAFVQASGSLDLTDAEGFCSILIPHLEPGFYFQIQIIKDGYVSRYISWSAWQKDNPDSIPEEYVASLEKAISVGGIAQNEHGEVVPAVQIRFSGPSPAGVSNRDRRSIMFHSETTDDAGRWTCNHLPPDFQDIWYELRHPAYLRGRFVCAGRKRTVDVDQTEISEEELRSGMVIMTLRTGLQVSGRIIDATGRRIAEAKVTQNLDWHNPTASVRSGVDGHFTILNAHPGALTLTTQAEGFAPNTLRLKLTNALEVTIRLGPGHILLGKVLAEDGTPIVGASVSVKLVDTPEGYLWSVKTGPQGEFNWGSAPTNVLPYLVACSGFYWKVESWVADGTEKTVVLRKFKSADE